MIRLRSVLVALVFATAVLVPVLAQPAVACAGGHGQAFLSGFAGGPAPNDVPTIFYAGSEGGTATATVRPTLSCDDATPPEIGRVQAHYVTEHPSPATAGESDYVDTDGTTPVLCDGVHDAGTTQCESDPDLHAIPITLSDDAEPSESAVEWFRFRLTGADAVTSGGGNGVGGLGSPSQARVYVVDADGATRPSLEPEAEAATHQKGESGRIRIPVFRAGPIADVSFTVTGHGSDPATHGQDFTCTPSCGAAGTLSSFPEAEGRLGFVQVNIINDTDVDGKESLRVSVAGAAATDDEFTTVTILDNDSDDDPPISRFHHPKDKLKYLRGDIRIREMHTVSHDVDIAGLDRVQIAVRQRKTSGACRWWNGGQFVAGACGTHRWVDMRFLTEWDDFRDLYGLRFPALTPSVDTKIRNYTAWTRGIDTAGNDESLFERGRNYSVFEVLRKRQ
jgi:hypothetical protein